MNISDWPLGRIMQLPDYVFGRRYMISAFVFGIGVARQWDISELAFPETAVIWEVHMYCAKKTDSNQGIRLALGDQLPTTEAEFRAMEPLFNGLGQDGPGPRSIPMDLYRAIAMRRLKIPVRTAGRRLVLEIGIGPASTDWASVILVVSGLPKEIPDCLISV